LIGLLPLSAAAAAAAGTTTPSPPEKKNFVYAAFVDMGGLHIALRLDKVF